MSKKCLYNFSNNINESNYANIDNSYQIFKYDEKKVPFLLWNDHKNKYFENIPNINQDNYYTNIDLMKNTFFSLENMDIIQNTFIRKLYLESNETLKINKIKNESLIQIMNQIWTTFCYFKPTDLKKQISDLNDKVVSFIFPILKQEYIYYKNYIRDSDRSNLQPIALPEYKDRGTRNELPSYLT